MERSEVRVGTAGWTIPAAVRDRFPAGGSQLERYAAHFTCAEINSTFCGPRIYYSAYDSDSVRDTASRLAAEQRPLWCIFDNTASGAAAGTLWR